MENNTLKNENRNYIIDNVLKEIKENKKNKEEGKYNSIPFGIPFLDKNTPGIAKGLIYCTTANTGIGKTKLSKKLFVNQVYKFLKKNPQSGINVKIFYFALEETKEEFMMSLICNRLYEKHNIVIDILTLQSLGNKKINDDILKLIEEGIEYYRDLENYLEIIDSVSNPYGIFNHMRTFFLENGEEYFRPVKIDKPKDSDLITRNKFSKINKENQENKPSEYCFYKYVPNDPNLITIGVFDHISLTTTENKTDSNTLHSAMSKLVTEYITMSLCKKYGLCANFVHQQEVYGDKQQFDNSGTTVINKLLPSINKLGDNKLISRDYKIILGLFSPHTYKIEQYLGYNIKVLKNRYRSLIILKNRYGDVGVEHPMLFLGAANEFISLGSPDSDSVKNVYKAIQDGRI